MDPQINDRVQLMEMWIPVLKRPLVGRLASVKDGGMATVVEDNGQETSVPLYILEKLDNA